FSVSGSDVAHHEHGASSIPFRTNQVSPPSESGRLEACHILTGAIHVHESKVCMSIPQGFRGEGTFVVNCEHLQQCDSNNDGLGSWGMPTGRNRYYGHSNGVFSRMDDGRGNLLPNAKYIWKCMMRRYEHPLTANVARGENRFIKKVRLEQLDILHCFPTSCYMNESGQGGPMTALPTTCAAYFGDCPLYAVGAIDFNAVASIILGGTIVDSSKICSRVPQGYRECGTFVIDLNNFVSDAELRRDNNGCWGKPFRYYKIDSNTGDAVRVDRGCKLIEGAEYDVQILSKRYEHPSVNGRFVRKIYTAKSPTSSCTPLAVMTYYWKGDPECFEAGPQRRVRSHLEKSLVSFNIHMLGEILGWRRKERQAALLDRFEAFMDRLERFSMCLPQMQSMRQVYLQFILGISLRLTLVFNRVLLSLEWL
ncbi:unnamed protein product, partial [Angiostrongylus costaricensis]|uniref:YDG domain-containing protein n=1 Tax=Angiostrongylus costaricensis TaxID=334426 RepID=A0A0R3PQE4_ANGCS